SRPSKSRPVFYGFGAPHPHPLAPEYRGEGVRKKTPLQQQLPKGSRGSENKSDYGKLEMTRVGAKMAAPCWKSLAVMRPPPLSEPFRTAPAPPYAKVSSPLPKRTSRLYVDTPLAV